MGFANKISKQTDWGSKIVHQKSLIYGLKEKQKDGSFKWFYILIDSSKERLFLKAINGSGNLLLQDFGKIVASGVGSASEEVKQEIRDKYNADIK